MAPAIRLKQLFRYSLIRELALPELTPAERGVLVAALAANDHAGPNGRRVSLSPVILRRWLRAWRAGGFEALAPAVRRRPKRTAAQPPSDTEGSPRITP